MPRTLSDATRSRILRAAVRAFGSDGYAATSVSDLATALGMGHGTFYRYFRSKRDLLDHVIDDVLGRIDAVCDAFDPDAPRSLAEHVRAVDAIGRALFTVFADDLPAARVVSYEAPGVDDDARARVTATFDRFAAWTARWLRGGRDRGWIRPDVDEDRAAAALTAVVFEGLRHLGRAEDPPAEAQRWVAIYQQLASGLVAR